MSFAPMQVPLKVARPNTPRYAANSRTLAISGSNTLAQSSCVAGSCVFSYPIEAADSFCCFEFARYNMLILCS